MLGRPLLPQKSVGPDGVLGSGNKLNVVSKVALSRTKPGKINTESPPILIEPFCSMWLQNRKEIMHKN